jgi:hypothetical protein
MRKTAKRNIVSIFSRGGKRKSTPNLTGKASKSRPLLLINRGKPSESVKLSLKHAGIGALEAKNKLGPYRHRFSSGE